MNRRTRVRWIKRLVVTATVLAASAVVTAWMMFQHIPAWYQPIQVLPDDVDPVKDDFIATIDGLSKLLNESQEPFEYRLTQEQINAWLAVRKEIWPLSRKWLPPSLEDPMIVLDPDGLRLAVLFRRRSLQAVVSARFRVRATSDGLLLHLAEVTGGDLPLPRSQVRKVLARLDRDLWPGGRTVHSPLGNRPLPPLSDLPDGMRLPNEWIWPNGKRPFRITRITFEPGAVRITFHPLPRSVLQRFR